jgi:hypothetical protein
VSEFTVNPAYNSSAVRALPSSLFERLLIANTGAITAASYAVRSENTSTAAAGVPAVPASYHLAGSGMRTGDNSSQTVEVAWFMQPNDFAANPFAQIIWPQRVAGGAWQNRMTLSYYPTVTVVSDAQVDALMIGANPAGQLGFRGTVVAKPNVTGSIGGALGTVVTNILNALSSQGLLTDSTTA